MRKLFKKSAAAIAIALSIACISPCTVSAATVPVYSVRLENKKINDTYDSSLISTDEDVIYATNDYQAYTAEKSKYAGRSDVSYHSRYQNDASTYYITQKTYKNQITGATGSESKAVSPDAQYADDKSLTNKIYVTAGVPALIAVELVNGDTKIKSIKSSNSKVLTAKLDKQNKYTEITDGKADYRKDKDGNYYYYTTTGKKVILPKNAQGQLDKDSAEYQATNGSCGIAYIKINPKKTGKSKISFKIYNKNGKKSGKASVTVYVTKDDDIFKTLSYGGQSLILKKYGQSNYINNGRAADSNTQNYNYTKKKKGKLIVKPNAGYKVVKIQVGTYSLSKRNGSRYNEYTNAYENENTKYRSTSFSGKGVFDGRDYNHDGDALDTVNGRSEEYADMNFKTVKSGKTIKLGRVGSETYKYNSSIQAKNSTSGAVEETTKISGKRYSKYAPTSIRITYYNKMTRKYGVSTYTIYTDAKKFK